MALLFLCTSRNLPANFIGELTTSPKLSTVHPPLPPLPVVYLSPVFFVSSYFPKLLGSCSHFNHPVKCRRRRDIRELIQACFLTRGHPRFVPLPRRSAAQAVSGRYFWDCDEEGEVFIPPHDAGVKRFNPMKVGGEERLSGLCVVCSFFICCWFPNGLASCGYRCGYVGD